MSRLLLAVFLLLAPLSASGAGGLAPRKASEIVKINQSGQPCPLSGYALDTDGLPNGQYVDFKIPDGKVLIVTGIHWSGFSGTPGSPVTGILSSQTGGSFASHYYSTTTFAGNGGVDHNELTPPIVIAAGRSICFAVTARNFNAATLYGFLASDK